MPPEIYTVDEAAKILNVSGTWLRQQLRARRFTALKIAGRWRMTGEQINEALAQMTSTALPPAPASPSGLVRNSRFRRRTGSTRASA
ncbi:hypothetical protein ABW16_01940 [Mycolicibacter heraklionensis]|uniref:Helix-turn-helix domain-containing protein n=1 Tax=Mycolicibacter heraklionensis TaxID=512402 RepID=A0ABR5FKP7_9MYCO|nr:helix-turn-helix domain-containing protein [Mycolicibacter heraklionensis]KLO31611.1 hypothetical protein ABW16_01940 [Mycolicibacter heraklionensis]